MQTFDVYFNSFESQLISYIEAQRVTHFFIKLKSKLKSILINYQDLSITKKKLLILICRLKNNQRKTIDVQSAFEKRFDEFKFDFNKNRKNKKNKNNENSFSNKKKNDKRENNVDNKKRKRVNHFNLICHIC